MAKDLLMRIDFLLQQIDFAMKDVEGKTFEQFAESDMQIRATSFSLVQIGEQMNRIEEKLKPQYPDLPWYKARGMRNLIVHMYDEVDAAQVYDTATRNLPFLKETFTEIRNELSNGIN